MFDLSSSLDLPLIFAGVLGLAVLLYVLLDGFDLGVGIIFPFAPSNECRKKMMNSIAPFWDGNETWLVLGGGGLFAFFPAAYAKIMPNFYVPIITMLLGLIFRGVAFEFHSKAESKIEQKLWDYSFCLGSLIAAFFQGVILGSFICGFDREQNSWNWCNAFSIMTGFAVVFGYALLGSTWTIMKTEGRTQKWARHLAFYAFGFVIAFMILVSLWTPFLRDEILFRWLEKSDVLHLSVIPLLTFVTITMLFLSLKKGEERSPFALAIALFALCYFGIVLSVAPYIIPYEMTFFEAAAAPESLSLLFVGTAIILPVILCYTAFSYWVFRGKASHKKMY